MFQKTRRRAGVLRRPGWAALAALLILASTAPAAEPWSALINPDNSLSFSFLRDDRPVFHLGLGGWGPKWAWVGLEARQKAEDGRLSVRVPFVVNKDKGEVIDVHFEAWQPAARQVAFRYDLESAQDVPLTMLIAGINFDAAGQPGDAHPDPRRGQADQDRPARARHPFRAGRVAGRFRLRQGRHGHDAARPAVPHRVRQRHARGAGVRPVPPRASAA